MKRALLALVFVATISLPARPYVAQTFNGKVVLWPDARVTVYHDPKTVTGEFVSELKQALAAWSSVPGSRFTFVHGGASTSPNVQTSNNRMNDVFFGTMSGLGVAQVYLTTNPDGTPGERDVVFSDRLAQWSTRSVVATGYYNFRSVAIHELGHLIGLYHQSGPTVMNPGLWLSNPWRLEHALYTDDSTAMRDLYPGTNPSLLPQPPRIVDLVLTSVTVAPQDPQPGDAVEVGYEMLNVGTVDTGGFATISRMTGGFVPVDSDPVVGHGSETSLAPGESRSGTIEGFLPQDLLPGKYRFAVMLDSGGAVDERVETNNAGTGGPTIAITRPATEAAPGQHITGEIGPLGEDSFTLALPAGAKVKLRGKIKDEKVQLFAEQTGEAEPLLAIAPARRAKGKFTAPEDGEYTVRLVSHARVISTYELLIRAKPMKTKGEAAVTGPVRVPIRVYPGSTVRAVVRGKGGFAPAAEFEGMDAPATPGKGRVRIGPFTVGEGGVLTLVVSAPPGTSGTARWVVVVKPAKPELEITR